MCGNFDNNLVLAPCCVDKVTCAFGEEKRKNMYTFKQSVDMFVITKVFRTGPCSGRLLPQFSIIVSIQILTVLVFHL